MDVITFKVPVPMKEALERLAKQDNRTLSNFVRVALAQFLRGRGSPVDTPNKTR
jgi:predicted transcriptional regulator